MQYRKPNALMFLTLVGLGVAVSSPAHADAAAEASRAYFKGPTSTCLNRPTLVYPCVSLSPPAYQFTGAWVMSAFAVPDLPLDSGIHDNNWLERMKNSEYWSKRHLSHQLQGMKMNFSLDHSGAGVYMDLGPLKLTVLTENGDISESRILLGIERSW